MRIILASSSPYRQALLKQIGLPFVVVNPEVDESHIQNQPLSPGEVAQRLAALKGAAAVQWNPDDLVIASDQVAHFGREILNKPLTAEKAKATLKKLSGELHTLSTALWVRHPTLGLKTHLDETHIRLRELSDAEINAYVKFDNPIDCAGAYKIESGGIALVENLLMCDQSAIVGLPLVALCRFLRGWNMEIFK